MKIRREVSRPDGHVDSSVVEVTADSSIGRMFAGQGAAVRVEVTHRTGHVTAWSITAENDADVAAAWLEPANVAALQAEEVSE